MTQAGFLKTLNYAAISAEQVMFDAQTVTDNAELMIAAHELDRAQAIFDSELIKIGFIKG